MILKIFTTKIEASQSRFQAFLSCTLLAGPYFVTMMSMFHICSLLLSMSTGMNITLLQRLSFTNEAIESLYKHCASLKWDHPRFLMTINHCRCYHIRTVCNFIEMNAVSAGLFLLAILSLITLNISMMIILVTSGGGGQQALLLVPAILMEYILLVGVHLSSASMSIRLAEPPKRMASLIVNTRAGGTHRFRVQTSLFNQTYVTKNRYGPTYWTFGLVSMGAFVKVSKCQAKQLNRSQYFC